MIAQGLKFSDAKDLREIRPGSPPTRAPNAGGWVKIGDFRQITSYISTRSSAIAEGPRDASCQLKSCQLKRNSAETTYTTSPDQIDGMKLEI